MPYKPNEREYRAAAPFILPNDNKNHDELIVRGTPILFLIAITAKMTAPCTLAPVTILLHITSQAVGSILPPLLIKRTTGTAIYTATYKSVA